MKKLLHGTFLFCLIITANATAQSGSGNTDSIISFETMHVHFDKDIYLPGETIWFKAYLYNVNEISLAATNFYVAIYDEKGKLIQQKQYPILSGSANGDFEIPDTIQGSTVRFRAFTKAMILHDSNNIYDRTLTIYQKEHYKNDDVSPLITEQVQLQFFPEGGQIIGSLQNYIGVTAINVDGSPAIIKGAVVETGQKKLYSGFSTNNWGWGEFIFAPAPGKSYTAVWTDAKGINHETALPQIKSKGVSLHAEVVDKELQYTLSRNITNDSVSILHLIAQMGNYELYKADLVVLNEMEFSTVSFSIDSFPAGLMQLTLFDKYWNKLQERNVFINEKELYAVPVIHTDSVKFGPKEKSSIEIVLSDTLFTSLSVSVGDMNFYNSSGTGTIAQDLLLNTQVKNLSQNISPLLKTGNSKMLDLVALNHRWRKYNWQKLVTQNNMLQSPLDNYLTIAAEYNPGNFKVPKDDALNLILYNSMTGKEFYNIKAIDATGYRKSGLIFFDSVKVAYQMDKNKNLASFLKLYNDASIKIPTSINALQTAAATKVRQHNVFKPFIDTIPRFKDAQALKEVIVKSTYKNTQRDRIEELDKMYASGMFAGTRGYQLNVIDDTLGSISNYSLKDYIRYRFPGLEMEKGKLGKWRLGMDAAEMSENIDTNPELKKKKALADKKRESGAMFKPIFYTTIIFLDEVEINYDLNQQFEMVNMSDVAYVKYIPGIVIGSSFKATAGAIYIYNKKGNEVKPVHSKGLPFVYIKGYDLPKEYEQPNKKEFKGADLRSMIYWNPNIFLNKANNSIKIEYFNNEVSKKLLLRIEGINAAGKLIHIEKIIE